jgi:hypothetical protein
MNESENNELTQVTEMLKRVDEHLREAIVSFKPFAGDKLSLLQNARQFSEEARQTVENLLKSVTPSRL